MNKTISVITVDEISAVTSTSTVSVKTTPARTSSARL